LIYVIVCGGVVRRNVETPNLGVSTDVGRSVSLRPAEIKAPALTPSQGKSLVFNAT
jgi:hypothetical protein